MVLVGEQFDIATAVSGVAGEEAERVVAEEEDEVADRAAKKAAATSEAVAAATATAAAAAADATRAELEGLTALYSRASLGLAETTTTEATSAGGKAAAAAAARGARETTGAPHSHLVLLAEAADAGAAVDEPLRARLSGYPSAVTNARELSLARALVGHGAGTCKVTFMLG